MMNEDDFIVEMCPGLDVCFFGECCDIGKGCPKWKLFSTPEGQKYLEGKGYEKGCTCDTCRTLKKAIEVGHDIVLGEE